MTEAERTEALRALAEGLDRIDVAAYDKVGRDPLAPVLGGGDRRCRVAIFGRDPGTDEVRHGEPFIGKGGQLVRGVLYEAVHGRPAPDDAARNAIRRVAFWANTVPYKPVGNKAWSVTVRRRFQPVLADFLVHTWEGSDVLCLGQNAFTWFGLHDREVARTLKAAWRQEPRFEGDPTEVELTALDGTTRRFRAWPLPHPSPLNATWHRRFPGLLGARLRQIGFGPDSWRVSGPS